MRTVVRLGVQFRLNAQLPARDDLELVCDAFGHRVGPLLYGLPGDTKNLSGFC